jgi:hypothetical protein
MFFHNQQKATEIFLHHLFYCRVYTLSAILKSNLFIPTSILLVGSAILSLFFNSHKFYILHIAKIFLCHSYSFYHSLTCKFTTELLVPEKHFYEVVYYYLEQTTQNKIGYTLLPVLQEEPESISSAIRIPIVTDYTIR